MKTLKLLFVGLSFIGIIASPAVVSADVNDFVITSFKAEQTLTRNDPQGELRVVERISVNFNGYNHGLLRAIPATYKGHSLQMKINKISSATNAPSSYSTYGSNGNTVLKIGDANKTVTGPQEYTVDYTLRNVISFYNDHDELYWDVNGDQWNQSFENVSVALNLPSDLRTKGEALCFSGGGYGQAATECSAQTNGYNINVATTKPLAPQQTLTYVATFEKGFFEPSPWYQTLGEYAKPVLGFLVPALLLGGGSILYWYRKGRDPDATGVIVPQYDAPNGLKPLAVGTLLDFKAENKDITATILDLAIRGYIKIIETTDKRILKDKTTYKLELLKNDFAQLDPNELLLINALFTTKAAGEIIDISSLKSELYSTSVQLSKNVKQQLTDAGYFRKGSLSAGNKLFWVLVPVFGLIYLGYSFVGWPVIAGLVTGGVIAAICANVLAARTALGVSAKEHALGLKLYLNVAEKDRIALQQAPNAKYASNANEPIRTVELFEKLLPYAIILGVEQQWARQFESLYTSPPDWYSGNFGTFNSLYLVNSLNSGISAAVNTAFSAPSSSSGSGSGGGGFSGGGGGGGGGGGW